MQAQINLSSFLVKIIGFHMPEGTGIFQKFTHKLYGYDYTKRTKATLVFLNFFGLRVFARQCMEWNGRQTATLLK